MGKVQNMKTGSATSNVYMESADPRSHKKQAIIRHGKMQFGRTQEADKGPPTVDTFIA